jgi:hypothetical protein
VKARLRWRVAVPAALACAVGAWWLASSAGAGPLAPAATIAAATPPPAAPAGPAASGPRRGAPLSASGLAERKAQLALWRERLDRAQQTLASYKLATRYPYESRPASEHADQWEAHPTIADDMPLRMPGGAPTPGVHIHKTQQSVFVSGADSALLTVAAVDDNGNPVPLRILSSVSHAPLTPPAPLARRRLRSSSPSSTTARAATRRPATAPGARACSRRRKGSPTGPASSARSSACRPAPPRGMSPST